MTLSLFVGAVILGELKKNSIVIFELVVELEDLEGLLLGLATGNDPQKVT